MHDLLRLILTMAILKLSTYFRKWQGRISVMCHSMAISSSCIKRNIHGTSMAHKRLVVWTMARKKNMMRMNETILFLD